MTQALPMRAPMGIGKLLDTVFRLYRAHFGRAVLTAAIFFVPVGLISSVLLGVTMSSYLQFFAAALDQPAAADDFNSAIFGQVGQTLLATLFVAMLGYVLGALAFLALTVQADADSRGQSVTIGASVKAAMGRFWAYLGFTMLAFLLTMAVLIGVYLGFILIALLFGGLITGLAWVSDANEIVAVGAVIIGMFIFLVVGVLALLPFVYLAGRWIVAPVLIYTERCGPVSALSRSWALTDGSFWRMTGLLLLLVILNSVVLALPVNLIQFAMLVLVTPQMFGVVNGLLTGLSYLVSILWYPFLTWTLVLVYYDLRVRKENYDLTLRVQALERSVRPQTLPGA